MATVSLNGRKTTGSLPAATPAPTKRQFGVARGEVQQGQVFRHINSDTGRPTNTAQYGAIGQNGRLYGVRLDNGDDTAGEASSASNAAGRVEVVGSYSFSTVMLPASQHRKMTRAALPDNAVFRISQRGNGLGKKTYINLGKLNNGTFLAVDTGKWPSQDHTIGRKGQKNVVMVGTYELNATSRVA